MKYKTDVEVKKALGIDSFRNLSRENVMRFAAMMPDMDREVQLKIVDQFPVFKAFALDAVGVMETMQKNAQASNSESEAHIHQAWADVRAILKGQLDDSEITWEQKKELLDLIMETARQQSAKDSENKQFLKDLAKYAIGAAAGAIALCVVYVGGRFGIDQFSGKDDEDA